MKLEQARNCLLLVNSRVSLYSLEYPLPLYSDNPILHVSVYVRIKSLKNDVISEMIRIQLHL